MGRKPFKAVPVKLGLHYRAKARRKRAKTIAKVAGVVGGAAVFGGLIGAATQLTAMPAKQPAYSGTVQNCRVIDGDTLRCNDGRVRLLGIDAPELPSHCAVGRDCAPGDPYESTQSLRDAIGGELSLRIERVGTDRYGRTLAMVRGPQGDLSCWQLSHGQAIYKPQWDDDERVARACPDVAR